MQALVVGGGPAGCACAIELARTGLSVRLIEAKTPRLKAGEVIPPSARMDLEELGLPSEVVARDHLPCSGVDRIWGADHVARVDYMLHMRSGSHLDRRLLEQSLLDLCRSAGIEVQLGLALQHLHRTADRWTARLSDDTECSAAFVVDASGRRAAVAKRLGVERVVQDRLVAFHAVMHQSGSKKAQPLFIEAVDSGWWYTTPLPGARRVFAFLTDTDLPAAHRAATADGFLGLLHETRVVSSFREGTLSGRPQAWAATSCRLEQFSGDGWLAVGDAALSRDPLSGGGIAQALQHGRKAAADISNCLKTGIASPADYDRYLTQAWSDHETERNAMYRGEQRWPWSPFWARRTGENPVELKTSNGARD